MMPETEKTMKIMIHACPKRMWYVEGFLLPQLKAQGAEEIAIWNDTDRLGNLEACMRSFLHCRGYGGTWHIQDDILPGRDFVQRCLNYESDGVVYGFCNEQFTDDPEQTGRVYVPDAWHSFQCVRIPDEYARGCADWFWSKRWEKNPNEELRIMYRLGKGDDTFFREYLLQEHGADRVTNANPNLVEHVDWIVGGSVLHPWRGYFTRAYFWEDEDLVRELKEAVKGKVPY